MSSDSINQDTTIPEVTAPGETSEGRARSQRSLRREGLIAAGLVALAAGAAWWTHARRFESTDDAQIDGDISHVGARVDGVVESVFVAESQTVTKGDLLAQLDPTDLEFAVAQARARVAQAQAELAVEGPGVPITVVSNDIALATAQSDLKSAQAALSGAIKRTRQLTAELAQARAVDRTAQLEHERAKSLVTLGSLSQSDYEARMNAAAASTAAVDALRESLAAAQDGIQQQRALLAALSSRMLEVKSNGPRKVETKQATVLARQAELDLARAQLAQAEKNLSYARIVAPISGIVARKSLAIGDHVSPGQVVLSIAPRESLWVTANFRETQVRHMHAGQTADVHVDALAIDVRGVVENVGAATGSRLSVLPPENASGNFVKVVQRIPVRIALQPQAAALDALRIGMSVEPVVQLR